MRSRLFAVVEKDHLRPLLRAIEVLGVSRESLETSSRMWLHTPREPEGVPIDVRVDGTYHNLGQFFDKVSRLSRLVNISDVKIRNQATPTAINTINASCTATTYVFIEPAEGAVQ